MENKLNITCNEAIKKLKAIGTALTTNWNSTYEKHVPIFFDFNYPRVNEGGICMDDITELFPRIAINMRNFKGPKSEIIDDNVFITTMVTLFHESRHMENYLQQYRFTRDNPEECRQMALSYLVRQCSDISYLSNYYSDPIEIDAEEFGVLSAYYYLQKNYPNLEYEQLILNYVNDRACDSNYYFFSIPKGSALTSIEEVENAYNTAFSESKNKAKSYDERVFPSKSNIRCLVDKRLVMDECWLARAHIEGTKNHEANKMIASLILHHYPEYLKKLPSLRNIDFTPEHYFDKDMLPDVLMKRSPISQLKSKILQAKNNEQEIDGSER